MAVYNASQIGIGNDTYNLVDEQARLDIANKNTIVSHTKSNGVTTITLSDNSTITIADGDDGNGISSITKTGTSGLVDTYTITYTSGSTFVFTVTNGANGAAGDSVHIEQVVTYDYTLYSYTYDGTTYTDVSTAPPDGATNPVETPRTAETTLPPAVEAAGTYIKHVYIKTWEGNGTPVTSPDLYAGVALAQEISDAIQDILDGNVTTTSND